MWNVMKYLRRNPARSVPLLLVIMLSVLVSAVVGTLIRSIADDSYETIAWAKPFVIVTTKQPTTADALLSTLHDSHVEKIVPLLIESLNTPSITGSDGRTVLGVPVDDMAALLKQAGWSITHGHLPKDGENEVVVSQFVAKALNLRVGSRIGAANQHGPLPGSETVVGIIDTNTAVTLMPYNALVAVKELPNGNGNSQKFLVTSNEEPDALASSLRTDARNAGKSISVLTYQSMYRSYESSIGNLEFIGSLFNGLTGVLLAFAMLFLIMVYLVHRMHEFATRHILGFSRASIIQLFMLEVSVVAVLGWALALVVYDIIMAVLEPVFVNHGLVVSLSILKVIPWTLPMPVVLWAASGLIAFLRLGRLKAIQVAEGNY